MAKEAYCRSNATKARESPSGGHDPSMLLTALPAGGCQGGTAAKTVITSHLRMDVPQITKSDSVASGLYQADDRGRRQPPPQHLSLREPTHGRSP
jgi:hypothetical protein